MRNLGEASKSLEQVDAVVSISMNRLQDNLYGCSKGCENSIRNKYSSTRPPDHDAVHQREFEICNRGCIQQQIDFLKTLQPVLSKELDRINQSLK
jgi:hypothetical protein